MSLRREISGCGVELGQAPERRPPSAWDEPISALSALTLIASVAMIAGDAVPPARPFPAVTRAVAGAVNYAARASAPGTLRADSFTRRWTHGIEGRAECIAEVFGTGRAEDFADQIAFAVIHLSRDPGDFAMALPELAAHLGVREDAALAARDLIARRQSFGAAGERLPAGGGALPPRPGRHFDLQTGAESAAPVPAPFPARKIIVAAKNGNPAAVSYVRHLAGRAPFDREADMATRALKRADCLHRREQWTGHYCGLLEGMRGRDPRGHARIHAFAAGMCV